MSYYYNYYVGYKRNGKIYPFGPYNSLGNLKHVISRSRNIASDLHDDFYPISEEEISEELREQFEHKNYKGENVVDVKSLRIDELPSGTYIRSGYFLIEDVKRYEEYEADYYFDGFYDCVSPVVYASMAQNEVQFGKPERRKDDFGTWYYPKCASDYMYYAYPDYESKEYEAEMIRSVAYMLKEYMDLPEDAVLLALETEG